MEFFKLQIVKIESNKPADNEGELNRLIRCIIGTKLPWLKAFVLTPIPGMHNARTVGQMWPEEALNLARRAPNYLY